MAAISRATLVATLLAVGSSSATRAQERVIPLHGHVVGSPAVITTNDPLAPKCVAFATDDSLFTVMDLERGRIVRSVKLPWRPVSGVCAGPIVPPYSPSQNSFLLAFFVALEGGRVATIWGNGDLAPIVEVDAAISGDPAVARLSESILPGEDGARDLFGTADGELWALSGVNSVLPRSVTATGRVLAPAIDHVYAYGAGHTIQRGVVAAADDGAITFFYSAPVTISVGPGVTAPVIAEVQEAAAAIVATGSQLHAIGVDGVERPGFPVTLQGTVSPEALIALGDVDGDGHTDLIIPIASPPSIDVRNEEGASLTSLGWPRQLPEAPNGPPILGRFAGLPGLSMVVPVVGGMLGLSGAADSLFFLPLEPSATTFPVLNDLDDDGVMELVVAGSEPALHVFDAGVGSPTGAPEPWLETRGSAWRTASSKIPAPFMMDVVPPAMVNDLTAVPRADHQVSVAWTSPSGGAAGDGLWVDATLRYSFQPIDASNFDRGVLALSALVPPGRAEFIVGGLSGGEVYFAVQSTDAGGNRSPISNVVGLNTIETIPPSAVTDLSIARRGFRDFTLRWTAPGDDGAEGRALAYHIWRSVSPTPTESNGTAVLAPAPSNAGSPDSAVVSMAEGEQAYFALLALDDVGNMGSISNAVVAQLPVVPPAKVADLRVLSVTNASALLEWTATGDDDLVGRTGSYEVRGSDHEFTAAQFDETPLVRTVAAAVDPGVRQRYALVLPNAGTGYWFALRARDPGGHPSEVSNVVNTLAGPGPSSAGIALAAARNPSRIPAMFDWQAAPGSIGQRQSLEIHDLGGRRVRTIDLGSAAGGSVEWDGRDNEGARVAAGLYVVRLTSGGRQVRVKLVLLP